MPTEKERLDAVEPKVETLISHAAQLAAELERVTARLTVLERRLSGAGDGATAELHEGSDELVATLKAAWDAEQELLADTVRVELRQWVAEFEGMKERRATLKAKLASGRVPRYERDHLEHEARALDWQIGANEPGFVKATERLAADAAASDEDWRQEAVVAGEKARAEIHDFAAKRVATELARHTRMPVWFRVGLGEITTPDPTPWLEAATDVVAYRLEYGVDDPVTPLGTPPSASSGSAAWVRRTNVHQDITEQLATLSATFRLQ